MRARSAGTSVLVTVLVALALAVLVACGDDGRELRDPPPGATAPPVPTSEQPSVTSVPLVLNSPAFDEGAPIPERYSCDGEGLSPSLAWGQVPAGTVELAITMTDPDANGFVHWIVTGIDPVVVGVGDGSVSEEAVEGRNTAGGVGWTPVCPPPGDGLHHYVFTLYALSARTDVDPDAEPAEAIAAITAAPGQAATLSGTYER